MANTTRAQSTTQAIRDMILSGELRPGSRLQAQMLADRLQVSRTPIVDALAVLHKDGLLEYAPHRGYAVKAFGLSDLLDAFDVRLNLEGLACRLVAERGLDEAHRAALVENLAQSERVLFGASWGAPDQEAWLALNRAFHDLFLKAAANAYLSAGVTNTRTLPLIYDSDLRPIVRPFFGLFVQERSQQSFRDHERIADAILSGQSARAENMMQEHIFSNREAIRRHLEADFKLSNKRPGLAEQLDV